MRLELDFSSAILEANDVILSRDSFVGKRNPKKERLITIWDYKY